MMVSNRITQARASRFGSNDLIAELTARPQFVLKTMTHIGPVYSIGLTVLPRHVVERQIEKGILLPRESSGQTFALSPEWGGQEVAA